MSLPVSLREFVGEMDTFGECRVFLNRRTGDRSVTVSAGRTGICRLRRAHPARIPERASHALRAEPAHCAARCAVLSQRE